MCVLYLLMKTKVLINFHCLYESRWQEPFVILHICLRGRYSFSDHLPPQDKPLGCCAINVFHLIQYFFLNNFLFKLRMYSLNNKNRFTYALCINSNMRKYLILSVQIFLIKFLMLQYFPIYLFLNS